MLRVRSDTDSASNGRLHKRIRQVTATKPVQFVAFARIPIYGQCKETAKESYPKSSRQGRCTSIPVSAQLQGSRVWISAGEDAAAGQEGTRTQAQTPQMRLGRPTASQLTKQPCSCFKLVHCHNYGNAGSWVCQVDNSDYISITYMKLNPFV